MCTDKALIERPWLPFAFCFRCFAAVSWSSTVSQLLMKRRVNVSGTTTNTCFIPSSEHIDLHNSCFIAMNSCWTRCRPSWRASRNNNHRQPMWMRNRFWCQHWQVNVFANCFNKCETDHRQLFHQWCSGKSGIMGTLLPWRVRKRDPIQWKRQICFILFSVWWKLCKPHFLWCISPVLKEST